MTYNHYSAKSQALNIMFHIRDDLFNDTEAIELALEFGHELRSVSRTKPLYAKDLWCPLSTALRRCGYIKDHNLADEEAQRIVASCLKKMEQERAN